MKRRTELANPALSRHVERHIGPIDAVFHEPDGRVHIDVHHVPPSGERSFHTLVTSGMSAAPMRVPPGEVGREYAELFLLLPRDWPLGSEAGNDERWRWPIHKLRDLARYPHVASTWLGCGHTIQNGDPPEPYAPGTRFCGSLVSHPVSARLDFAEMRLRAKSVFFYQVIPLYEEELRFARRHSSRALLARFGQYQMDDVVDPLRHNLCCFEAARGQRRLA